MSVVGNAPAPDPATSPATQFAERAEAEYIKALSDPRMSRDAGALRAGLSAPLKASPATPLDQRNITRNLTITTSKAGDFNPDDRLELTEVFIKLDKHAARITSWDNATSIYNVINAGTLQVATTKGAETDLSLGTPSTAPVSASIGEKLTSSTTTTQTANANFQAESLTVAIEDEGRTLRVRRQGGPGVDLTGNVAVKLGLALADGGKLPIYQLAGLFDDKGKPADATKVSPSRVDVNVGPDRSLEATVAMTYVMRHVTGGGGSLAPGTQDVIEHVQSTTPVAVTLVPLHEAYPQTYGLFLDGGGSGKPDPVAIQIACLPADSLCFATYDEAQDAQRFLALRPTTKELGGASIGWSDIDRLTNLTPSEIRRLQVRSNCAKPPPAS